MKNYIQILISLVLLISVVSCNSKSNDNNKMVSENQVANQSNLPFLNEQITENPTAINFYARYKYYIDKNELTLAMEDLNNAIAKDSTNGNFLLAKVKLLRQLHRVPQAIKTAQNAEKYLSQNIELNVLLAEMYFILKQYQKSIEYCNKTLQISPFSAEAYFYKGMVYSETGDTVTAISSFETAIEQNTDYVEAYNNLIMIYNAQKKYDLSKQYIQSGLRFSPNDAFINYNAGVTFNNLNQKDTSAYFFKKAILADSTMYLAYFNLGSYYFNKSDYSTAVDYFETAIKLNKELPDAYYFAALCHQYTENWDMAQKRFENGRALYVDNKKFEKSYDLFYKELKKVKKKESNS